MLSDADCSRILSFSPVITEKLAYVFSSLHGCRGNDNNVAGNGRQLLYPWKAACHEGVVLAMCG